MYHAGGVNRLSSIRRYDAIVSALRINSGKMDGVARDSHLKSGLRLRSAWRSEQAARRPASAGDADHRVTNLASALRGSML